MNHLFRVLLIFSIFFTGCEENFPYEDLLDLSGSVYNEPDLEFVDLGLPSGIKWATRNFGATKAEEYGAYYAWGEVNIKESYTSGNSLTYDNSSYNINISGNMKYDVASYRLKGTWRMPTEAEFSELVNNCVWEWMAVNGVNGYKVTSIANGNSIFLPAAGYKNGSSCSNQGSEARYWSGTYRSIYYSSYSYCLVCGLGYYQVDIISRYYGCPIRPVCE